MNIVAHRGISLPDGKYHESSWQAFDHCLKQGWGIEFDANFTKGDEIVIWHDDNLARLTEGQDKRGLAKITVAEFKKIGKKFGQLCDLQEVLLLIVKSKAKLNALHLKGRFQTKKRLDKLVAELRKQPRCLGKIIIFDVKPAPARYLKKKLSKVVLAASVSHIFDIKRYNKVVGGTLLSAQQIINHEKIYDWAWLDEWDLIDRGAGKKMFYTEKIFKKLNSSDFKIAVVTPELHSQEGHTDSKNQTVWRSRLRQIIHLKPGAICTDYPSVVRSIYEKNDKKN